jgi:hypothetical protein
MCGTILNFAFGIGPRLTHVCKPRPKVFEHVRTRRLPRRFSLGSMRVISGALEISRQLSEICFWEQVDFLLERILPA